MNSRVASTTCYTTSTVTPSNLNIAVASPDPNTAGCGTVAGYVFRTNCYDDLEKAAYISGGYYASVYISHQSPWIFMSWPGDYIL